MNTENKDEPREIVFRTRGREHGPITRLMSPGDIGQLLKPFIFLDHVNFRANGGQRGFDMHPHSGLATLTFLLEGDVTYEDTTGKSGVLPAGGVEWMRSGNGVWHKGGPANESRIQGFQLWVALPPSEENAVAESLYLSPTQVPQVGPVRVMLGKYGAVQSLISAPSDMNYLAIHLNAGEQWDYEPPIGHNVAWLAVNAGKLKLPQIVDSGELIVFKESNQMIRIMAQEETTFVLGSAVKHPYELVMGTYSVHTNQAALEQGQSEIRRIGQVLKSEGRLT